MARFTGKPAAAVALVVATLLWSSNYIIGEILVDEIRPINIVLLRWLIAAIPLLALAWFIEKPDWRAVLRVWPWILILGLTGLFGFNLLLYFSLAHTTAVNAALITAFNPALITAAAAIFLKDRLTPFGIAGVALALFGVFVVLGHNGLGQILTSGFGLGELYLFGAILMWTAYTILGRMAPQLPPITSVAAQAVVATVASGVVAAVTGGFQLPQSAGSAWVIVYLAILSSVVPYLLWNGALRVIPPSRGGVFLNLITVFTVLTALVLGSRVSLTQLVGGAVILCGVALTYVSPSRGSKRSTGADDPADAAAPSP